MKHSALLSVCFFLLIIAITSVAAARQNPLKNPKVCGRPQCKSDKSKFAYGDSLYKYDYNAQLTTEFAGTGDDTSDLAVKATVELMFPKPCEGFLRITSAHLSDDKNGAGEHAKSQSLEQDLKKNLLRFDFHDGQINEVCPDVSESAWVLNFKKGILSALQNTMMRFDVDFNTTETDVAGTCKVHYALESTANAFVTIRKEKDIESCHSRFATHSILQSTPYTFSGGDNSVWPVLDSESYCNMTIDNNIYREVSCYERHQLIAFSNSSSGAVTTINYGLQFKGEEHYSPGEFLDQNAKDIVKRSTLLFDHAPMVKPTHGEIKASREHLKAMCAVGYPNIKRDFIDVFTKFLETSKSLDYKALTQLLARADSICEHGKKHVLEALPYIGSTASYQLMRDQIVNGAIEDKVARSWMTSMSFIQRPDEETLNAIYTILEYSRKKVDAEYTLGASAVVHSFCKFNENCHKNPKVKRIVNLLESEFQNLYKSYQGDRAARERMVIILKGLGNIGVLSDPFGAKLQEVILQEGNSMDMRLEAVMAFRRVDCMKYRKFFIETYGKYSVNAEVRILSYLQTMRCPDHQSVGHVKAILQREEVNQVGSFVWSHMKNLAKSSSPTRVEAQGLLQADDIPEKFKMDFRKFSRNYDFSVFFDEYNLGTTTDLNVIFGTDSYLPHMASWNFTAELFGQSINFFEISARTEGFDKAFSTWFGDEGVINSEWLGERLSGITQFLGSASAEGGDVLNKFVNPDNFRLKRETHEDNIHEQDDYDFEEDLYRPKRSPANQGRERKQQMRKEVKNTGHHNNKNNDQASVQVGLRVFGNDMRYYSLEGMEEFWKQTENFDPIQQLTKLLSGDEVTYSKSRVFLDTSYNVPLGIGLPLSIKAFGASSVDMRLSGDFNTIEKLDWHFDVNGKFKPSVSVDVITSMQTDLFYAISGIKVKSNLYSNSEIEAQLKVRGKSAVSFTFDLPQETNEIFSSRSEILVLQKEKEIPQKGIEHRRSNNTCSWAVLDEAIGLQLCSTFSVPDLAKDTERVYPSLLLSGPMDFSVKLKKADPSATKYVFEYNWDEQSETDSTWSLLFHTPGSSVKRVLVANVTHLSDAFKSTLSFVNGKNQVSAGCNYHNHPNDRQLDVYMDTNGKRSFDLNVQLVRWQDRTTMMYKPKMLLAINGVNVTGLIGSVRVNEKNGIKQNGFELSFETKKLQALVKGEFVQNEVTATADVSVNYRFQSNKMETINFDAKLQNTGDKSKTEYQGTAKMISSAYPKLNFKTTGTWLSLQGHTEGTVTFNNGPKFMDEASASTMRVIFARAYSEDQISDGSRTRASLELKVPKSKVDYKISFKHEERTKNGTEHNVVLGLRYAPEKEATGLFSVHLPRRNLFAIDAYMNVTVPDFDSCNARIKITESPAKTYVANFNGAWFTGHSISVKGNYKDKSSRVQSLHNAKLIIESPSFKSTTVNVVYKRNQQTFSADIQAKYGKDPYGLTVNYNDIPANKNTNAEVRLKLKDKDYWVTSKLSQEPKSLQIEIHLDKIRDIHIKAGALSIEQRKELTFELKWDANRDPAQRLALLAEFNNPGNDRYDGNIMITYPDRTISCGFEAFTGGPQYHGSARVSWSTNDLITLSYNIGVMPGKGINNWIHADLNTPFEGWRRNSMKAGLFSEGNLLLANSSFVWANDQALDLNFKSDHKMQGPVLSYDLIFGINSTVKGIPEVNVKVTHYQDQKKYDTFLSLVHSGPTAGLNEYSVKSVWEVAKNGRTDDISGTVAIVTPFEGYRRGGLAAKFSINGQHELKGAATLDFENRQFTIAVDGYVRKMADSQLTIDITTPLEKYRTITGRFGLNEKQRHAVAEIRSPDGALGVEVRADVVSLMDFDVKLSVATPIENFRQAAVVAKVKPDSVDLRGTYNNATAGFAGVWRLDSPVDFEYSYTVYTPLPKFEENGFVAKFVARDVFILELHARLSTYKVGVKINGHPKSKLMTQLGGNKLKLEVLYDNDFRPPTPDPAELQNIDYTDCISYNVDFQIDPLMWESISGSGDIQEVLDFYLLVGHVDLPQGRVELKNRLYYPDYMNILNVLTVKTPFEGAKELKSIAEYNVDLVQVKFHENLQLIVIDSTNQPKVTGVQVDFQKVVDSVKPNEHTVKVSIKTPLITLSEMNIWGNIQLDENMYRGNISSRTPNTFLTLAAALETEENFTESSVDFVLNTDVVPHYACRAYFKHDFSEKDNTVDMQFTVTDNDVVNEIKVSTACHKDPNHLANVNARITTTMLPLKLAETSLKVVKEPNPQLSFDLAVVGRNGERIDYGTRATKKNDAIDVEVWTPIEDFRNISLHGSLTQNPSDPNEYRVSGNLYRNMHTYGLNGAIKMANGYPTSTKLRVQPSAGGPDGVIEFSVSEPQGNTHGYNFQFSAIEEGKMCQISGGYSASNETGVDFSMLIESSLPELKRINFNGQFRPRGKGHTVGDISLETPWKELGMENVKLHSDLNLRKDGGGKVGGEYRFGEHVGRGSCAWTWVLGENMQLALESHVQHPNVKARNVHASAKYLNPNKNFQRMSTAVKMDVDSQWKMDANATLNYRSADDVQATLITSLPQPVGDTHNFNVRYRGNLAAKQGVKPEFNVEAKYKSKDAQKNALGRLTFRNATDLQALAHLEWGEKKDVSVVEGDFHVLRKNKVRREFYTKLVTPKYKDEDTFYVKGTYDVVDKFHNLVASMASPASRQIADLDMSFKELNSMHGYVNTTTPLPTMDWLKGEFDFNTKGGKTTRFAQASWPSDTAFFKSQSTYNAKTGQADAKGTIEIEVPLATRHRAEIEYGLRERGNSENGFIKANYNGKQFLNGIYKSAKDTKGPVTTITKDVTLENEIKPLGIHYVNKQDNTKPEEVVDVKRIEVFELKNAEKFKLSAELTSVNKPNGHDIKLVATHPNRSVTWTSNYDGSVDRVIDYRSRLELSEDAWIAYKLHVTNQTNNGVASQKFVGELSYPKRTLATEGSYTLTDDKLESDAVFKWNNPEYLSDDMKAVRTGLVWQKQPLAEGDKDHETFVVTIGHPYLEKDVVLKGKYYRGNVELLNTNLVIDYSNDESHAIVLGAIIKDLEQELGHTNYTIKLYANHAASDIDLQFNSTIAAKPSHYKAESSAVYKKQYFTEKSGQLLALLNIDRKELEYIRWRMIGGEIINNDNRGYNNRVEGDQQPTEANVGEALS